MGALLDADVYPEARWQGLLKPHAHAQANDGGKRTVGDGRGDFHDDGADVGMGGARRLDVDIRQIDDSQGAERKWMLRVGDGRDQVCRREV